VYIFSVWGPIDRNEFAEEVERAVGELFPQSPPRFLSRTPHGHGDPAKIEEDLRDAGWARAPRIEVVTFTSRAPSPDIPALAYAQGTVMRSEIEAIDPSRLDEATQVATAAIAKRFGSGPVAGIIEALVVTIER
jgi:hypothetical protein